MPMSGSLSCVTEQIYELSVSMDGIAMSPSSHSWAYGCMSIEGLRKASLYPTLTVELTEDQTTPSTQMGRTSRGLVFIVVILKSLWGCSVYAEGLR